MTISKISELLEADILCCGGCSETEIISACGSDMMSDVLAFVKNQAALLTGLVNPQVVKTAEMMDMHCVVFVRNKIPSEEIVELAREAGIVLLATRLNMFEACGRLYNNGLVGS